MLPAVHLLTAPGREAILAGTLASWDAADWGVRPVIHRDEGRAATAAERIPAAWCAMLRAALAAGAGAHLLLLEDDLAFHPRLAARLAAWEPLRAGAVATFASLYNPGIRPLAGARPAFAGCFVADPRAVSGAQALVLARAFGERAVACWADFAGLPTSFRLALLAARDFPGAPLYYHAPSLVQHTATFSAWGAALHRAEDFDPLS